MSAPRSSPVSARVGRTRPPVAAARACAFRVIRRVFERGAYADRAFAAEARRANLDPRDRALAMQLSYGAVQRRLTLDHLAETFSARPVGELDPPVQAALRLGLFQLLYLDGIAPHAAVNESVELAKAVGSRGSRLVNAVLRRAAREGLEVLGQLDDDTPVNAAILHSVPGWLASQWWRELGEVQARALLARVNQPAESALRVNTLTSTPAEVMARLPVSAHRAPGLPETAPGRPDRPIGLPEGIVLEAPFDVESSGLWLDGAVMPQSRASMVVGRALGPRPGDRVLDLCAAPGAKTSHIAALMRDEGQIVAVERNPGRARALVETCARLRARSVRVEVADGARRRGSSEQFDRVLVDPPCSGLGTLQSRPDIRWRASPESIAELARLQALLLRAGAAATAMGGLLVYSVCTISRAEGEQVVDEFLREHREFGPESPHLQLLPHRDRSDGFFVARLRRNAG